MVAAFLIGAILGGGLGWALCLIARDYFTAQAMEQRYGQQRGAVTR